eukprot:4971999-Prymnesium_polylepis.2
MIFETRTDRDHASRCDRSRVTVQGWAKRDQASAPQCTLQLLSSSGQIATVLAHWTLSCVKVPCKNIKAVTLGGYVCNVSPQA